MNRRIFKGSNELVSQILDPGEGDKVVAKFAPLWNDEDDDKTVIEKYRAFRARCLSDLRFQLVAAEAATHRRLKQK